MPPLRVHVFGKLRLSCGDAAVSAFPTRHVEELLAYLLLNQQIAHDREKLITILWPDCDSKRGRARFSTALWRLKGVLKYLGLDPNSYIRSDRNWISFINYEQPVELDLDHFARAFKTAQTTDSQRARENALRDVVDLAEAELLSGLYTDWCLLERERFERLRLRSMGQLMHLLMERKQYLDAVDIGHQVLRIDPLREEIHRAVMRCYGFMGRRSQAARQFQLCTQHLMNELGISPLPETVELYQQIVSQGVLAQRLEQATRRIDTEISAAMVNFQRSVRELNDLLGIA